MKFHELPTTGRGGRKLELENGRVRSVSLSNEDHGCLSAWLYLDIGSGGACGFGGYKLGNADGGNLTSPGNYAAEWIVRCINVVLGSEGKWEDLAGQPVRVLSEGLGGTVVAVGHFLKDEWFCPKLEFEKKD